MGLSFKIAGMFSYNHNLIELRLAECSECGCDPCMCSVLEELEEDTDEDTYPDNDEDVPTGEA